MAVPAPRPERSHSQGRTGRPLVLITAGPTREAWDPVRYLTNESSGRMGYSIAAAFAKAGARVALVSGPTELARPRGVELVPVTTAREMLSAVRRRRAAAAVFIATAAVSDWRFARPAARKVKTGSRRSVTVRLVRNPDILKDTGLWRARRRAERPLLAGFALETGHVEVYARRKLSEKRLDLVIGNGPGSFGADTIRPLWVEAAAPAKDMRRMTKASLAARLVGWARAKGAL